jgi:hypothetical protein
MESVALKVTKCIERKELREQSGIKMNIGSFI